MSVWFNQTPTAPPLTYKGTWDANSNTPTLSDSGGGGVANDFYVVSVAGSTSIDGVSAWVVGDWILHNGTTWSKVPYTAPASPDPLENTYRVSDTGGDFTTISDAITAINALSQTDGVRIVVDGGVQSISDTIIINAPFPIMIEGGGSYSTLFTAATGLENKPMFDIRSDCFFTRVGFDGTLAGWAAGTTSFLYYNTAGVKSEVIDFIMDTANKGIIINKGVSLFGFNFIIDTCAKGIEVNTSETPAVDFEVGNIVDCTIGMDFVQAASADLFFDNIRFFNPTGGTGIKYDGANVTYASFVVSQCVHNFVGTFLSGFDFTLARDAGIFIKSNVGEEDKRPHCKINVASATATQSLTAGAATKLSYVNSSSYTTKFTIANNKITYLAPYPSDLAMWVSMNIEVDTGQPAQVILGIVKNNTTTTYYGQQGIFLDQSDRPFSVSMNAYIDDVKQNDYFEIFATAKNTSEVIRVVDVNWLTIAV